MSAIERAAVARTSTSVSSISMMIVRIIRAGSSARSRSSVMFAAKISRARLNTGPLSQPATGASRDEAVSGSLVSTGVRTGTWASRISSSGIEADLRRVGISRSRTDRRANGDRAHDERRGQRDQGASELRQRRQSQSPFSGPVYDRGLMPIANQGACQSRKTAINSVATDTLAYFANQELAAIPKRRSG